VSQSILDKSNQWRYASLAGISKEENSRTPQQRGDYIMTECIASKQGITKEIKGEYKYEVIGNSMLNKIEDE